MFVVPGIVQRERHEGGVPRISVAPDLGLRYAASFTASPLSRLYYLVGGFRLPGEPLQQRGVLELAKTGGDLPALTFDRELVVIGATKSNVADPATPSITRSCAADFIANVEDVDGHQSHAASAIRSRSDGL